MLLKFIDCVGWKKADRGLKQLVKSIQYWLVASQYYKKAIRILLGSSCSTVVDFTSSLLEVVGLNPVVCCALLSSSSGVSLNMSLQEVQRCFLFYKRWQLCSREQTKLNVQKIKQKCQHTFTRLSIQQCASFLGDQALFYLTDYFCLF